MSSRVAPPRTLAELEARVQSLRGQPLDLLAAAHGFELAAPSRRRKGRFGQLVERALGAHAGSLAAPDFVELGVELKTLPLDARGRPRESTFVCTFGLAEVERADWASSAVRAKLSHVLFVPLLDAPGRRVVGEPFFWRPSPAQEAVLQGDFDDLVGMVALGRIEELSAHHGRWLQIRPKAAHGAVRTWVFGPDGDCVETIPRGFYLRARFTRALLNDRRTLAGASPC